MIDVMFVLKDMIIIVFLWGKMLKIICLMIRQCIGKKTKYSFYGMVIAVFICYVSHLLVKSPFIVMYFKSILIVWKRIFSIFSL